MKYTVSEDYKKKIENGLAYHPMKDQEQGARYAENREAARVFAEALTGNCPPSRELSLALTHLQTTLMFANAAIAVNE